MPLPSTTLIGNKFNVVTSLVEKSWESLGFNVENIAIVHLVDPESNIPIKSWDPSFPDFSELTGVQINKKYIIQPSVPSIETSDFHAPTVGDTPSGPTTLVANKLNARSCDASKTWAELGWTNENIGIVYLVDPEALIPIQSWDPNFPSFSEMTGIIVGKHYLIQPINTLTVDEGFYTYSDANYLPISTVLLTSFDEFGYDTEPVVAQTSYGGGKVLNGVYDEIKLGKNMTDTDFVHMLREDADKVPGLVNGTGEAIVWLNWFTEGSSAYRDNGLNNPTTVRPMLQRSTFQSLVSNALAGEEIDDVTPTPTDEKDKWRVGPYNLVKSQIDSNNKPVTKIPLALKGGGTMNDQSFINGAVAMQTGNWHENYPAQSKPSIKVGIAPIVIAMRPVLSAGSQVVDESNYQNWRGYITFNNESDYDAFALEYEAFVKHYIDLCYNNSPRINLSTIYVGSEFEALLTADYAASDLRLSQLFPLEGNPNFQGTTESMTLTLPVELGGEIVPFREGIKRRFMKLLGDLGLYAKTKFPLATMTYAANWTDYNRTDALWCHPGIDAIGIDWYMPVSEIHTNDESVMEANFFNGEQGVEDSTPGSIQPFKFDSVDYNEGFELGKGRLSYMKDLMNAPESSVMANGGIGKIGLAKIPIVGSSHLLGLKRVREYREYLQANFPLQFNNKPIIATELGISSMKGASVEPNVFPFIIGTTPTNLTGSSFYKPPIAPLLPEGHNMKELFTTLQGFNLYIGDVIGSYGSSFEMDQDHQYIYLKKAIEMMNANGITKQVIYTLDARPSGMFGAVSYNTEADPPRDEVYTYDTPVFPLNLAINGKRAGGWDQSKTYETSPNDVQNLLDRIVPKSGNAIFIDESTASLSYRSFVPTDLLDYEWKANTDLPNSFQVVTDNGVELNPGKVATGSAGRFAYFRVLGDVTTLPNETRVSGRLNFEAKSDGTGDGLIEIVIFGQGMDGSVKKEMKVQTRKTFTLTSEYQLFGWNIPLLYPEQEYVLGVFLKGYGPLEEDEYKSKASLVGVTATFKKNFCLLLNQAGMEVDKPFYRVRADAANLLGNAETDWYGWSDTANAPRKKYLQSSAYSRLRVETDAVQMAVEFVRDAYNTEPKNLYYNTYDKGGRVIANATGGYLGWEGPGTDYFWGAVNNATKVQPGKTYVISGLFTGIASGRNYIDVIWLSSTLSPIGTYFPLTNLGTPTRPIYQTPAAPLGAARLAIQTQVIPEPPSGVPGEEPNPLNDSFEVTRYCMIEEGVITQDAELWPGVPDRYLIPSDVDRYNSAGTLFSGYRPPIGDERLKLSGYSVFVDGNLYQYHNVEDGEVYTFHNGTTFTDPNVIPTPTTYRPIGYSKEVQLVPLQLPPLPTGVTSRIIDVISSGRGTYLPTSPLERRSGLYLRALYLNDPNPTGTPLP